MDIRILGFGLALAAAQPTAVAAPAPLLDVKLGTWEMTSATTTVATISQDQIDRLPSDRRAGLLASVNGGKPVRNSAKLCMTLADLAAGPFSAAPRGPREGCVEKTLVATPSLREGILTCVDQNPRTATIRVEALSRESIKGEIHATYEIAKAKVEVSGKWLEAACAR